MDRRRFLIRAEMIDAGTLDEGQVPPPPLTRFLLHEPRAGKDADDE